MIYFAFCALFLILWAVFYAALPVMRHLVAILANLIARASVRWARVGHFKQRYGGYGPVVIILIAGALFTAWIGDSFVDVAEMVHAKSPRLQDLDTVAHAWAISKRSTGATTFFSTMSFVGGPPALMVLVVIVSVALITTHRYRWFLYLAVTAGGGSLLNMELKRFFARARPDLAEMLRLAHGYSFPSGHAMGSTVVFGALSYLAFRTATAWPWKSAVVALGTTLILAISLSRVYLGVHWISDVGAGIAAGTLWVAITTIAYETLRRLRLMRRVRVSAQ